MSHLIINRRLYESLTITTPGGEQIQICVDRLNGQNVRLGIRAPLDCLILRDELDERPGSRRDENTPSPLRKIA